MRALQAPVLLSHHPGRLRHSLLGDAGLNRPDLPPVRVAQRDRLVDHEAILHGLLGCHHKLRPVERLTMRIHINDTMIHHAGLPSFKKICASRAMPFGVIFS